MHTINLQLPTTWQALTDKQLRFVLHLLASDHTAAQVKTLFLLRFGDRSGGCRYHGNGRFFHVGSLSATDLDSPSPHLSVSPTTPTRYSPLRRGLWWRTTPWALTLHRSLNTLTR